MTYKEMLQAVEQGRLVMVVARGGESHVHAWEVAEWSPLRDEDGDAGEVEEILVVAAINAMGRWRVELGEGDEPWNG